MGENKFLSAAVNLSRISNKIAIVVDYKKSIKLGKHTDSTIKLKFITYEHRCKSLSLLVSCINYSPSSVGSVPCSFNDLNSSVARAPTFRGGSHTVPNL